MKKLAIALLVVALAAALPGCREEEPAQEMVRPVRATQVGDVDELARRSFPGRAKPAREVNLAFRVQGPLVAFDAKVGDDVNQGDLLARIDPRDFEVRLSTAAGQLERAQASLKFDEGEFERVLRIREQDSGAVSDTMVQRRRQMRDAALATVSSLQATVKSASDAIEDTYLRAPFDGTIVATYVKNYEEVLPKQPVLRMVGTEQVEFEVAVPESQIAYAPHVEKIEVRFDALGDRSFEGRITEIGREASAATRTYPVTIVIEQGREAGILPGMSGVAKIVARLPETPWTGIGIPPNSVFSDDASGSTFVWTIDEESGEVSRRTVEIGTAGPRSLLVKSGLEPGEWIATAGVHSLREGQRVRILNRAETTP